MSGSTDTNEATNGSESVSPNPLHALARTLEREASLDRRAATLGRIATPLADGPGGPLLAGAALGHAMHPLLTDFPLGCWTSASLLDLVGGWAARPAARRLVALGLLGTVPTVLSGLVEFDRIDERADRRVGAAHAIGNSVVAGCQLLSWRARRNDRQLRGVGWTLAGNGVAAVAGYLGGHLLSARGVGIGPRGTVERAPDADRTIDDVTAPTSEHSELSDLLPDIPAVGSEGVQDPIAG